MKAIVLAVLTVFTYGAFGKVQTDASLNFTELAIKYGQQAEEYDVVTTDGYILKLFRIFGDAKKPVLLLHGAIDSSDDFVLRGNTSLAVNLARKGHDVWALNHRGNRYSRRHVSLNPDKDPKFWDFSIHELGAIDLPDTIDFITNITRSKLTVIGYSQGTTTVLVMGSVYPEYNKKIKLFLALAPVCYLQNTAFFLSVILKVAPDINKGLRSTRSEEFVGFTSPIKAAIDNICGLQIGYAVCILGAIFSVTGFNVKEFEPEFIPTFFGHYPAGTSRKNLNHYAQIGNNKVFANYDYGEENNMIKYGSKSPPVYDLSKVTMKIAIFMAKNDGISTLKDVYRLKKQLPNVVDFRLMKERSFNHIDFVWGKTMHLKVQPRIFEVMDKYDY